MNIFVLDTNPSKAAAFHNDKHVVKMILETAQLLSAAHHVLDDSPPEGIYRKTHVNHPCSLWARESSSNYKWLLDLGFALCQEYTNRYGKVHKTQGVLDLLSKHPKNIPSGPLTSFKLAMPDEYKKECPVESYRAYYVGAKKDISTWKTKQPYWFPNH